MLPDAKHIKPGPYASTYKDHVLIFADEDIEPLNATFIFDDDVYPWIERSNAGDPYAKRIMDTYSATIYRNVDAQCLGTGFTRCLTCGRTISHSHQHASVGGTMLLRLLDTHPKHPSAFVHRICLACCYPSYKQPEAMRRALDIVRQVNA